MSYSVRHTVPRPLEEVDFSRAEKGVLTQVWPDTKRKTPPHVEFRVLHDDRNLYVAFDVSHDSGVRIARRGIQVPVHLDSCCEIFLRPKLGLGYFNFEMNAGGSLTLMYIEDPSRTEDGFRKYVRLPADLCRTMEIRHTMPDFLPEERNGDLSWSLRVKIPYTLFEHYVGPLDSAEKTWLGAVFSCAEEVKEPSWQAWTPILSFNFHNLLLFRDFVFEDAAPAVAAVESKAETDLPDACPC